MKLHSKTERIPRPTITACQEGIKITIQKPNMAARLKYKKRPAGTKSIRKIATKKGIDSRKEIIKTIQEANNNWSATKCQQVNGQKTLSHPFTKKDKRHHG